MSIVFDIPMYIISENGKSQSDLPQVDCYLFQTNIVF